MTSDMGLAFNALKKERQAKRAQNRESSPAVLRAAGVDFTEHNGGAHLVVSHGGVTADFWPGTGLWKFRSTGIKGRGVRALVRALTLGESTHA